MDDLLQLSSKVNSIFPTAKDVHIIEGEITTVYTDYILVYFSSTDVKEEIFTPNAANYKPGMKFVRMEFVYV